MSELDDLEVTKKKIELAKRKQDAAILQQIVEPLAEAIEELNGTIKLVSNKAKEEKPEPEYFDKELGAKLDKVFSIWEKFKPTKIDLSPITNIASAIEKQNNSLINLVSNLPKGNDNKANETLMKEVMAMVQRNMDFVSKGLQQFDYTKQFSSINDSLEKLLTREITSVSTIERSRHGNQPIEKVTTVSTTKTK